ncbi:MAG TPA: tripartite tricarboxylate transporter permease [Bacillota bacterium]|nr:tripartite tricarboxylate transporter permease [Bacillota bacterium]
MQGLIGLLKAAGSLMSLEPLLLITAGIIVGILAGAMPGVSPSMGVALMVPFTYAMDPSLALVYLAAIYLAANYGGSITAVTINTPGTPSAVVTAFDGYPLAKKGRAGEALGVSLVASFVGGAVGIIVLILFSGPLARVALKFWPAEYFSLSVLGLSTIASMGGQNAIKSAISAVLGLLICTIGMDPVLGVSRFTFGNVNLFDGFEFIPMLIGLLALSEVFAEVENFDFTAESAAGSAKAKWPSLGYYWKLRMSMLRASIIGTIVGIFPGAGATIATFISYDVEKRFSSTPEEFGQGMPEGVAAAEASNSASVGGALVPMLTLGIPGSATAAVLMGALMIHNLQPGPELFVKSPELIYKLFASLLIGNIAMLILGLAGSRLWINVTRVRKQILFPLIFAFAMIGSYAVNSSMWDVMVCLGFGVLGWILKRYGYPLPPLVLGMVLGEMAEVNLRRAVMMAGPTAILQRPGSVALLVIAALSFAIPILQAKKAKERLGARSQ